MLPIVAKFVNRRAKAILDEKSLSRDGNCVEEAQELVNFVEELCSCYNSEKLPYLHEWDKAETQLITIQQDLALFIHATVNKNGSRQANYERISSDDEGEDNAADEDVAQEQESDEIPVHGVIRPRPLEPSPKELAGLNGHERRRLKVWYAKCTELRAYKIKYGHCNVPVRDKALGKFVRKQRDEKKKYEMGLETLMTEEKLKHLHDLGFEWKGRNMKREASWAQHIKELKAFKEKHGHCRVPQKYPKLGKFVMDAREHYRAYLAGKTHYRLPANGGFKNARVVNHARIAELTEIGTFEGVSHSKQSLNLNNRMNKKKKKEKPKQQEDEMHELLERVRRDAEGDVARDNDAEIS